MRARRAGGRYAAAGEEEEDVELYPGVQELITATLHAPHKPTRGLGDFAAELSHSSSILRFVCLTWPVLLLVLSSTRCHVLVLS